MEDAQMDHVFYMADLLGRRARGCELLPEEERELDDWLSEDGGRNARFESIRHPEKLAKDILLFQKQTDTNIQFDKFNSRLSRSRRLVRLWRWASVAAIMLITGLAFWTYTIQDRKVHTAELAMQSEYGGDALPGGNKATLKLSSGKEIKLNEQHKRIISDHNGIHYADGTSLKEATEAEWAILQTAKGGTYKVTLPDGTTVTLNAASALRYPVQFLEGERKVELQGEAYFDVASMPDRPFIVQTAEQKIKVLGTQFNVRAYSRQERTSLLEGKVQVENNASSLMNILPGEQVIVSDQQFVKRNTIVQDDIAWLSGQMVGTGISLEQLAFDLERWYDVSFVYSEGFTSTDKAYININRNEKLSAVLKALEQTYKVNFKVKGKEVLVY